MAKTTNVTRIRADETKNAPKKTKKSVPKDVKEPTNWFTKALAGIGGYFKGAWVELKQVRWPSRKATWGLTLAVLIFSGVLLALIVSLDLLFKYLFEIILS